MFRKTFQIAVLTIPLLGFVMLGGCNDRQQPASGSSTDPSHTNVKVGGGRVNVDVDKDTGGAKVDVESKNGKGVHVDTNKP